ncbi:UPF0179 family protein [Methanonatronarchaeum sp. AMET-Sl]|uniref:UPF0179 family protein n=1 Tax=Methanonatronarchaeum sp. AMET-Sl TaxID=3037654 RepID=UPI00244DD322|nr:UPF0179 family protein [Methanonatronarchaeum sp. AMET-Sl]WGI18166.1 UPF0179 family protein [Methanonatronarchaeum sp. AMET-Sl]
MTDKVERKVTLSGARTSKIGNEFVFLGPTPECDNCDLKNTCMNLKEGRKYRVVKIKGEKTRKCPIHDQGVKVVEVIESPIIMAIESDKAFKSSKLTYKPINCDKLECKMYKVCNPEGIEEGKKFKIKEIIGDLPGNCEEEIDLKLIEAKVQGKQK